jgi:flavin-dependent dehydrogenase
VRARRLDAIVAGGGPAGSACAIVLSAAGRAVAMLHRDRRFLRAGDVLPPSVRPLLEELGVWERFRDDGHLASPGVLTAWGAPEPQAQDFIWSAYGDGWHVDRRRFDALLSGAAERAGASMYRDARATGARRAGVGWRFEAVDAGEPIALDADFLVQATGRSSSLTGRVAATSVAYDRLIGAVATIEAPNGHERSDPRMLVEATENGWWYSAPLPGARMLVAWMTDPDVAALGAGRRRGLGLRDVWLQELGAAPHTRARLPPATVEDPHVVTARSCCRRAADGHWLAAGDAAAAYDPLSGQGLTRALQSGRDAAAAIIAAQNGDSRATDAYAAQIDDDFARYLRLRAAYYEREDRWPGAPFWKRRHSSLARLTSLRQGQRSRSRTPR